MPELPEVETVRNVLKHDIIGKKILKIEVNYPRIIRNISIDDFCNKLINQTFNDVLRKGKYLIFVLDDYYLISHLRMEGKYFLMHDEELNKHDHVIFTFEDSNLRYNDTRKFGTMYLYLKDKDIYHLEPLNKVGYEPFDNDCNVEYLHKKLSKSHIAVKTMLLDQSIMAGLGNIYVDEVLFMCHINPEKKSNEVTDDELNSIIENSIIVLNKAIKLGGTTIRSFMSSHAVTGRFQNELLVHTKEECPICHGKIDKKFVNGRGTYYCKHCQGE